MSVDWNIMGTERTERLRASTAKSDSIPASSSSHMYHVMPGRVLASAATQAKFRQHDGYPEANVLPRVATAVLNSR